MNPKYIYIMYDTTDDRHYYPLGAWLTLDEAIAAVKGCKDPSDFDSDSVDYLDGTFTVEIYRHIIGWWGTGKSVFKRTYIEKYDEATDEYKWETEK